MSSILLEAAERANRYVEALPTRNVAPTPEALAALDRLTGALGSEGVPEDRVIAELDEVGGPATVANAGGRYFGFVIGGGLPVSVAANWLAGAWNQNTAMEVMSPVGVRLERTALEWIRDLVGLGPEVRGAFVTGDTVANFSALLAARQSVLERVGHDVARQGMAGAPPVSVVVGEEVHVSMLRAIALAGLGRDRVVRVPVDDQGRMRADRLPEFQGPTIVCTQAGNVNSGAFDPVPEISRAAHAAGAWVHVDGAFGLWARASPRYRGLAEGVESADSWALDGHKWLNVPYDSGAVFLRDWTALRASLASGPAAYLPSAGSVEPFELVPEMSRRARGIDAWAALRHLGRSGVADLVDRCCAHALRFARRLEDAGFRILNDVVLNQVLVSFGDEATTRRIIAELQRDGTCWCGGTVWHGTAAMRISVSSWATTTDDVDRSVAAMIRLAGR